MPFAVFVGSSACLFYFNPPVHIPPTAYCPPVVHLSFERLSQSTVLDESDSKNNGLLANGAQIVPHGGKCDNAVNLQGISGKVHSPNLFKRVVSVR